MNVQLPGMVQKKFVSQKLKIDYDILAEEQAQQDAYELRCERGFH